VLVVDDDPTIRALVTDILEQEGYPVASAQHGAEALRIVEHRLIEVVLLDMRMPVLDGWGFAREVQARGMKPRIVVMSAAQDAGRWAAEIRADGYLAKPFELSELLSAVECQCDAA